MEFKTDKYVLLTGSDLGERLGNLNAASALIQEQIGDILEKSSILESEPWGFESETQFLNQALLVSSPLSPGEVLREILSIENKLGRKRESEQWISRIIDIDILCKEHGIHTTSEVTIPHKLLSERLFALKPLCEIVPNWNHPLLGKPYSALLNELEQQITVESLD